MNQVFAKALRITVATIKQNPTNKDLEILNKQQHEKFLAEIAKQTKKEQEAARVKQEEYLSKPFTVPTREEVSNAVGHWIWNDRSINEIGGLAYDKYVAPALKEIKRLNDHTPPTPSHSSTETFCPRCGAPKLEPVGISGVGTIYHCNNCQCRRVIG